MVGAGKVICVFCSSSSRVSPVYRQTAFESGRAVAACGWTLLYGGTTTGMMDEVARGARESGGRVIGVVPEVFRDMGITNPADDVSIGVADLFERKKRMIDDSDAFLILPGGTGTLDEFFEVLSLAQLRLIQKPIVVLNINNVYQGLITLLADLQREHFIPDKPPVHEIANTVDEAINLMARKFSSA